MMPVMLDAPVTLITPPVALKGLLGDGGSLPEKVKILGWGENRGRTTGARIFVGEKTLEVLAANQELTAHDTVALDYEHQSVKCHPDYKPDPRHSAAHGRIEVVRGEGVYLSGLDYTPNGVEHAASYKDVSAVAHTDADGELVLVSSVALTQQGDVAGMEFGKHVEALNAAAAALSKGSPFDSDKPKPSKPTMDENEKKNPWRELLINVLGIQPAEGDDAITDEAITAAAEAFGEKTALAATGVKQGEEQSADVIALAARLDKLEKAQALSADESKKQSLVDAATAAGKVIPLSAEDIAETPVNVLSAMIDRLEPGEVRMADGGSRMATEKPGEAKALSADEKAICENLGLTEDEWRAAGD